MLCRGISLVLHFGYQPCNTVSKVEVRRGSSMGTVKGCKGNYWSEVTPFGVAR